MQANATVLVGALVAVLFLATGGVLAVFLVGGPLDQELARAGIITAMVGPTVAALLALLQGAHTQTLATQTKDLVNGHLEAHVGHSDAQIRAMIDERISASKVQSDVQPPKPGE